MKKSLIISLFIAMAMQTVFGQKQELILPIPSETPSPAQLKQIERKYGMFIHFGINTFHNEEWTDGSKPASSYCPTTVDADQWIRTAKEAGMKYVILITKHHDGFCLWDSPYTEYDVANSGNTTNVVEAVAKACKKYQIGLGLYYSLWDRKVNADVEDQSQDAAYNDYMLKQLDELIQIVQKHTHVVEFWFDGGWVKPNYRWPVMDIYQTIKSKEPECQVGINWSIGLPSNPDGHMVVPEKQQAGFPIRYFPSDFRLGDPYLPTDDDPKVFTHDGKNYYMPWESTICLRQRWFYHTEDTTYKSVSELAKLYRQCTKNNNILILNCPPNREGKIREKDIEVLKELRRTIQDMESVAPTSGQQAMLDRKYGMFLHFGMNTYLGKQWSDGTDPASAYNPPADLAEKAAEWVRIAKKAGMRSIVLTTKHHEGFCLWDSKYTEHDIANPAIPHKIDVVKAVSDACRKEGIAFSIYYSLWDRNAPSYKDNDKHKYIVYMKNQLEELMTQYGPVAELWFDGAWDRKNPSDWYLQEVYDFVKKLQPDCQIATNWTIGKHPIDMQDGDSILYFPSDFRLWDPFLPTWDDPKVYLHQGKAYYLPFESTQTISVLGNWFYDETDRSVRDLEDLEEIFYASTRNNNCLLLNIPPDKNGVIQPEYADQLYHLAKRLSIENGKAFPREMKRPTSLTAFAKAQASSTHQSDEHHYGALLAVDSDVSTSWMAADSTGWLEITLQKESTFNQISVIEGGNHIKHHTFEIKKGNEWIPIHEGAMLCDENIVSFMGYGFGTVQLSTPVTARKIRLNIQSSNGIPVIYSIRVKLNS